MQGEGTCWLAPRGCLAPATHPTLLSYTRGSAVRRRTLSYMSCPPAVRPARFGRKPSLMCCCSGASGRHVRGHDLLLIEYQPLQRTRLHTGRLRIPRCQGARIIAGIPRARLASALALKRGGFGLGAPKRRTGPRRKWRLLAGMLVTTLDLQGRLSMRGAKVLHAHGKPIRSTAFTFLVAWDPSTVPKLKHIPTRRLQSLFPDTPPTLVFKPRTPPPDPPTHRSYSSCTYTPSLSTINTCTCSTGISF